MTDEHGERHEPVGSVAEEAARLLGALQGWAGDGTDEGPAGGAGLLGSLNEHIATGDPECRYCPLCQVISAFRETSPEVRHHLSTAASSLLQAATGVLQAAAGQGAGQGTGQGAGQGAGADRHDPVQRIDLDDDSEWED